MPVTDPTGSLPAEVQAIIDAALAWADAPLAYDANELRDIYDAVDAYRKATAPPEPFDAYIKVFYDGPDGSNITTRWDDALRGRWMETADKYPVWRCTVTPIERVR